MFRKLKKKKNTQTMIGNPLTIHKFIRDLNLVTPKFDKINEKNCNCEKKIQAYTHKIYKSKEKTKRNDLKTMTHILNKNL